MDYLTVVTAAGKSLIVSRDGLRKLQIVRRVKISTTTGTQSPHPRPRRQQLFLSLAGPHVK